MSDAWAFPSKASPISRVRLSNLSDSFERFRMRAWERRESVSEHEREKERVMRKEGCESERDIAGVSEREERSEWKEIKRFESEHEPYSQRPLSPSISPPQSSSPPPPSSLPPHIQRHVKAYSAEWKRRNWNSIGWRESGEWARERVRESEGKYLWRSASGGERERIV